MRNLCRKRRVSVTCKPGVNVLAWCLFVRWRPTCVLMRRLCRGGQGSVPAPSVHASLPCTAATASLSLHLTLLLLFLLLLHPSPLPSPPLPAPGVSELTLSTRPQQHSPDSISSARNYVPRNASPTNHTSLPECKWGGPTCASLPSAAGRPSQRLVMQTWPSSVLAPPLLQWSDAHREDLTDSPALTLHARGCVPSCEALALFPSVCAS